LRLKGCRAVFWSHLSHVPPDHAFRHRYLRSNRADEALALEEDARLRNDIRLLGRILGDTVRDQEGADVFDLVERIRQTSIRFHRDDDKPARRELELILDSMSTSRDRAHRARLQLFFAPRQHRRGSEQHPADARALGAGAAASGTLALTCRMPRGRLQRGRSAPFFR
jgi:phosphoenolpyruvate carboxylase